MPTTREGLEITPSREAFVRLSDGPAAVPVRIRVPARGHDPVTVLERIRRGKDSFLLESVKGTPRIGRYSYVGTQPFRIFRSKGEEIVLQEGIYETRLRGNPFAELRRLHRQTPVARIPGLPPFPAGAVGMISYDAVHFFECLPRTARDDLGLPDLYFVFVDTLVVFDHMEGEINLIHVPLLRRREASEAGRRRAYDGAVERLQAMHERLRTPVSRRRAEPAPPAAGRVCRGMAREEYMEMVRRAKAYIKAGDIFQANLSQRLTAEVGEIDALALYRVLRRINPSPFAAFLDFQGFQIVSSSPERLIRLQDGVVETRPIAGTRPRGRDARGDRAMSAELIANEKERAEHIMLIDLERNDIGRVCEYGSVQVDEFMVLEEYSHVIHIVSNVRGRLHGRKDLFDLIRATFPGGTITGVPKVRCMEIIDELEPVQRGPYTGSIGILGFTGDMDLNIVIRTFVLTGGRAHVQVGAGIVADSDPAREYDETLHKARALLKALEMLPDAEEGPEAAAAR